jgi:PKD repeat protein
MKLLCRIGAALLFAALATGTALASSSSVALNQAVTITVDAAANRHPISPFVYGVAYGNAATLADLNAPLNRYGGNNASRYNWQQNADNRGSDWYFESIGDASSVPGERGDSFISTAKGAGAQAMVTVPTIDWVARLGANRGKLASFSQAKYGAQTGSDWQWFPNAGNGVLQSTGQNVAGNDPNDANVPNTVSLQQSWVQHIVSTWGTAANGGPRYYELDNEPSIWFSTHRDVHPVGPTMDEIKQKIVAYGSAIKSVDPSALVFGPEEWGWSGYFYSGYDQQYGAAHNWCCLPDRAAHGNWDYIPWLLDQLHQYELQNGKRLLDVLSVHYYPQGGEFGNDTSTTMQLLRNKSTRSLWDPNYVDQSWINDKVMLIPRLKSWVAKYYPGLETAITEYNWGAESHINGATAQADIFGIFGREGLDFATRWGTPDPSTPTYKAIKLYRNYDGNKSAFGDTSVATSAPDPDNLSAFGAVRSSDGAMTVMVVSKFLSGSTPITLSLANFAGSGTAQAWQLTAANAITRLPDLGVSGSTLTTTVPAQSVTLFVLPAGGANKPPVATASATPMSGVAPLTVGFDGSASYDPDGSIASYGWDFGDGSTASGATPSHTYTNAGSYTATLTVTDNTGATAAASVAITASTAGTVNAPSNLTGSVSRTGVVTLTWTDNSSNEEGFYVERTPQGSTSYGRVGQVAANVTTYSEQPAKGRYTYRVLAYNATTGQLSAYSNSVSLRVR